MTSGFESVDSVKQIVLSRVGEQQPIVREQNRAKDRGKENSPLCLAPGLAHWLSPAPGLSSYTTGSPGSQAFGLGPNYTIFPGSPACRLHIVGCLIIIIV